MSNSPSVSDNRSTSDPEEVIRLVCPDCDGKLNLRRKHIGIAGNCVHCRIPVMAVEEDGDVFLRLTQKVEENPRPTAPPAKSKPEAPDQPPAQSENTAESNAPSPPLPADGAAAASSVPQSPSPPDPSEPSPPMPRSAEAETSSRWGFPDREPAPRGGRFDSRGCVPGLPRKHRSDNALSRFHRPGRSRNLRRSRQRPD